MGPASAVADPHSRTMPSAVMARARPTFWPRPRATSSPSARLLRTRPVREHDQCPRDEERQPRQHHGPVAPGNAAHLPEAEPVQGVLARDQDDVHQREQPRAQGGARQGELDRRRAVPAHGGNEVNDDGGSRRADEREPDVAGQRGDAEDVDSGDHGQRGAGVDADDARVRQRVPGHALHGCARQAQRRTGEQAQDGPRDPRLHHGVVAVRRVEPGQCLPHGFEGQAPGAHGK